MPRRVVAAVLPFLLGTIAGWGAIAFFGAGEAEPELRTDSGQRLEVLTPDGVPLTPEEARRIEDADWEKHVQAFESERVDEPWAALTSAGLGVAVAVALGPSGATVTDVMCKTTMCRVSLEWTSGATVAAPGERPPRSAHWLGCARHTRMNRDALTSVVFYDCGRRLKRG